nr:NAD-binding protein [Parvularcula dongshanensis]
MGKSVEHAGPIGAGATAKLLVNAALGTQVAMMAELLSLGAKLGLEPEKTLDLLSATPWASPAAKTAGGLMVKRSFDPLFPVELVAKDLGYAAGASEEAKTPIIDAARALFEDAEANGLAAENMSAVVKRYEAG